MEAYLNHVEKYLFFETKTGDDLFISKHNTHDLNKSGLNHFEKDKQYLLKTIQDLERENDQWGKKYSKLEKTFNELSFKYNDYMLEAENTKSHTNYNEENLKAYTNELNDKLMRKDIEIEDLKKDSEMKLKRLMDEITKYKVNYLNYYHINNFRKK